MVTSGSLLPMARNIATRIISQQSIGRSLSLICDSLHHQFGSTYRPTCGDITRHEHHTKFYNVHAMESMEQVLGESSKREACGPPPPPGKVDNAENNRNYALEDLEDLATYHEKKYLDAKNKQGGGDDDNNNKRKKREVLPWRHESYPLLRIEEKNDYSYMPNNFRSRFVRRLVACRELNLSPLQAIPIPFFAQNWESTLANNFKTAFELALIELLTSTFHDDEVSHVKIGQSITYCNKKAADNGNSLKDNEYLNRMLDKNLIAKYQHINTDNLHLTLSINPIEANLESIFAVPLLSREIVEKKPHLHGAYLKIEKAFEARGSYNEIKKMTHDLANEIGEDDAYTRTVIADATIYCKEFFQIKDASTGFVVQGMEDDREEEEVVHHVRFEVVTEKSEDGVGRKVGQWKIIDIDDLLEGNVFH